METLKSIGFVIAGLVIFIFGAGSVRDAWLGRTWPTTEGVVTYRKVSHYGDTLAIPGNFQIEYTYTVDGVHFKGHTISAGQEAAQYALQKWGHYTLTELYSDRIVARYPTGKTVKVFYNPRRPDSAQLEPGFSWWSFAALAIGVALAFFGGRRLLTGKGELPSW